MDELCIKQKNSNIVNSFVMLRFIENSKNSIL